jgi:hypothetical protein
MHDHSDLKSVLADYLQSILTHKPEDILNFSAQYFAPYSSKTASNNLLPATNKPENIPKHY